jgi:YggT family protein
MLLIQIVDKIFLIYFLMLMIRILGSWVPQYADTAFMRFIAYYTDPFLNVFRRIIPPLGMIDISPIVAFIALQLLEGVVKWGLIQIMVRI